MAGPLDAPVYRLDHQRGMLIQTSDRFQKASHAFFSVYGHDTVTLENTKQHRLQVSLDPPEYIVVPQQPKMTSGVPQGPDYITFSRASCPLFSLENGPTQRLQPTGWFDQSNDRVFLFSDAANPVIPSIANQTLDYLGYANIAIENEWGEVNPDGWVSWSCLDHLTPWPLDAREDISLAAIGTTNSPFIYELSRKMMVPWNLLASDREQKRQHGESCKDILHGLPTEDFAMINTNVDDYKNIEFESLAVAVFICAEHDANGQLAYTMRPNTIHIPTDDDDSSDEMSLDLLVFNLSPQEEVAFGALAHEVNTISAFHVDQVDPMASDLFLVKPGVEHAIWVQVNAYTGTAPYGITYATGPLSEHDFGTAETWLEEVPAVRGNIVEP